MLKSKQTHSEAGCLLEWQATFPGHPKQRWWRTVQFARQNGLVGVMRVMKAFTGFRISLLKIGTGSCIRLRVSIPCRVRQPTDKASMLSSTAGPIIRPPTIQCSYLGCLS